MRRGLQTALCVVAIALVAIAPLFIPTAEDAAILFQYSDHLARTGVISYVAHGRRVEGATDFLWMAMLALGRRAGISPHWAAAGLNVLSLCGLGWIFATVAGLESAVEGLFWTALIFLLTPQMAAAVSGFSVLPFGFLLALMLWSFVREKPGLTAASALLLCLMRPDGVVFAIPLLLFDLGRRHYGRKILLIQAGWFYVPGLVYFLGRAVYFHRLLPLPFTVKSQAVRWLGVIVLSSLGDISRYLVFALLVVGLLFYWNVMRGATAAITVSGIAIPTAFYLTMRLDQNLADRFFFFLILVPAFLLCLHREHLRGWSLREGSLAAVALLGLFAWPYCFAVVHLATDRYLTDSVVAEQIRQQNLQGEMAVSEAGVLAYRTGWPTVDLWGLNTPEFAMHLVQPCDIAALRPDVIVLHHTTCEVSNEWPAPSAVRLWKNMAENVLRGSSNGDFEEFQLPYSQSSFATRVEHFTDGKHTHLCYFVRRDYGERAKVEAILAGEGAVSVAQAEPRSGDIVSASMVPTE